ncbi:MAG: family 20 glycosylhydrolase [Bacteroidales bacterium]|nr:family 20 glycosylhydrolase [Bacteroidales bacterium]
MMQTLVFALAALLQIIPAPVQMEERPGTFKITEKSRSKMEFVLEPDCGLPAEGYTLEVTRSHVRAVASTEAGLFYARETLRQLEEPGKRIPCVKITDYPRFRWRGFHLDPCRHFLPVEDVKKYIDILSAYKMNVMHWHLTDDQGWRMEIKRYPRLTEVGAVRRDWDGSLETGFYTQEEIADVVAYAAERFVTVVPEIEMPGHARAAIAAYPGLACTKETQQVQVSWGSPDIVMCPGNEFTFKFLEDVIEEVVSLFPSPYIHIGGDECLKNRWELCPDCQARIRAEGFSADSESTAEQKLQSYAIRRMEGILAAHGRKLIGWDEILEGGLSPNATVMSWRGETGGIAAALSGHDVIMTPSRAGMYLDFYQGDPKIEPIAIGSYTTLEKAYRYDPVPEALRQGGKVHHVLGLQCNNWSEYLYTVSQRDYMLFPRVFAVAETGWTPPEKKDWESFRVRVEKACHALDLRGVNYHIPLPEQPGGSCNRLAFTDQTTLELTTTRPVEAMVYTLDGSEPTAGSARYDKPLRFTESAVVKVASLTPYGRLSTVRTITLTKQEPWPATAPQKGIKARRADGRFVCAGDLKNVEWKEVEIGSLRELVGLEPFNRNLPDTTRYFAAEAEGSFHVPSTGVYRFSSDCDQVWIDGRLVIDNGDEVKRFSRQDTELALAEGAHQLKVVYIYNVLGGWNSLRNQTDVLMKGVRDETFGPVQLY